MSAVGDEGNEVEVVFLRNSATVLIVESASARLDPPVNEEAVDVMRYETDRIRSPPEAQGQALTEIPDFDFDEFR